MGTERAVLVPIASKSKCEKIKGGGCQKLEHPEDKVESMICHVRVRNFDLIIYC